MGKDIPAYRLSKLALNGVTRHFAAMVEWSDVLINSVCPGYCRTDMGGPSAPMGIEEGVKNILAAVDLPKGGPNGEIFDKLELGAW